MPGSPSILPLHGNTLKADLEPAHMQSVLAWTHAQDGLGASLHAVRCCLHPTRLGAQQTPRPQHLPDPHLLCKHALFLPTSTSDLSRHLTVLFPPLPCPVSVPFTGEPWWGACTYGTLQLAPGKTALCVVRIRGCVPETQHGIRTLLAHHTPKWCNKAKCRRQLEHAWHLVLSLPISISVQAVLRSAHALVLMVTNKDELPAGAASASKACGFAIL